MNNIGCDIHTSYCPVVIILGDGYAAARQKDVDILIQFFGLDTRSRTEAFQAVIGHSHEPRSLDYF